MALELRADKAKRTSAAGLAYVMLLSGSDNKGGVSGVLDQGTEASFALAERSVGDLRACDMIAAAIRTTKQKTNTLMTATARAWS